jgi:hypothetical protein
MLSRPNDDSPNLLLLTYSGCRVQETLTTISVRLQQFTKRKDALMVAGLLDLCNEKRRELKITHPCHRYHPPTLQVWASAAELPQVLYAACEVLIVLTQRAHGAGASSDASDDGASTRGASSALCSGGRAWRYGAGEISRQESHGRPEAT